MSITDFIMNIYEAQNDETNITTRPFFFIWMYFIGHYKVQENIHNYSKLISISQLFSHN